MDPNQIHVQPQVQQTIPQPVQPKRSFSLIKILLVFVGIIIVLILIGGAYYLGAKSNSKNINSYTQKVSPTQAPTPTTDPTASWLSYTEKTVNLTVKYPQDWSYVEQKTVVSSQFPDGVSGVSISGVGGSINIQWGGGLGGGCDQSNIQTVMLGTESAMACHMNANDGDETWVVSKNTPLTTFMIKATANSCGASGCGPQTQQQIQQTLADTKPLILSILSHITFTSQTSDWKTYSEQKGVYSFSYPSNWYLKESNDPVPCVSFSDIPNVSSLPSTHQLLNVCYLNGPLPTTFPYDNGQSNNPTVSSITINGYTGLKGNEITSNGTSELVFLKDPNSLYPRDGVVNFTLWQSNNESMFNQMLSTFKFTQ